MNTDVTPIWAGVPGTTLNGLYGSPFLPLDDVLAAAGVDLGVLPALHDEICLGLAQVPVDYTGGSHRSMGIMPASRTAEAVVDYVEVLRALSSADWALFVGLSDRPDALAAVDRADIGEEKSVPLSRRQMLWLKVRHGVYFPWKSYIELIPNRLWTDKSNAAGKEFTRAARQFFPGLLALIENLPFDAVGRANIMGLEAHDHGTIHHDGIPAEQDEVAEFITLYPAQNKSLFLWDEVHQMEHVVSGARAVWFNDHDFHGVKAAPVFRYSIRVDGVFTSSFRDRLRLAFAR